MRNSCQSVNSFLCCLMARILSPVLVKYAQVRPQFNNLCSIACLAHFDSLTYLPVLIRLCCSNSKFSHLALGGFSSKGETVYNFSKVIFNFFTTRLHRGYVDFVSVIDDTICTDLHVVGSPSARRK